MRQFLVLVLCANTMMIVLTTHLSQPRRVLSGVPEAARQQFQRTLPGRLQWLLCGVSMDINMWFGCFMKKEKQVGSSVLMKRERVFYVL